MCPLTAAAGAAGGVILPIPGSRFRAGRQEMRSGSPFPFEFLALFLYAEPVGFPC
jgi:hypothetical protein